jgi:hypothetical protein
MTDDNQLSREEQALLTEYMACEEHVGSSSARSWQATGIILAAALAGLFIFASFSRKDLFEAILATVFLLLTFVMLLIWSKIVRREVFFQLVSIKRMRDIESKLGLRKSMYINILDHWQRREKNRYWATLPDDEKKNLEENYARRIKGKLHDAPQPPTSTATYWAGWLVVAGWFILVILRWMSYFGLLN